jgi:hypothetical protein
MGGKLTSVLERTEHGHHVLRAYAKNAVIRMYEKFSTFLRLEALSNNLKDFGLNKGLDHLDDVRRILAAVTDRFAAFEAQALERYAYRLTDNGTRAALLFVLFHQRVCGPLANSLFHHRPNQIRRSHSKLDAAYRKADRSLDQIIRLLAA